MEKDKLRKIAVAMLSVIVIISVIAYLNTLPKPVFERPYWISIVALLFLYWIIFINWSRKISMGRRIGLLRIPRPYQERITASMRFAYAHLNAANKLISHREYYPTIIGGGTSHTREPLAEIASPLEIRRCVRIIKMEETVCSVLVGYQ